MSVCFCLLNFNTYFLRSIILDRSFRMFLTFPLIYFYRLGSFIECCKTVPELGEHMENGINIDSIPLTMEEFSVAGDMNGKVSFIMINIHFYNHKQIRIRIILPALIV